LQQKNTLGKREVKEHFITYEGFDKNMILPRFWTLCRRDVASLAAKQSPRDYESMSPLCESDSLLVQFASKCKMLQDNFMRQKSYPKCNLLRYLVTHPPSAHCEKNVKSS
jgi:hypothetical protein